MFDDNPTPTGSFQHIITDDPFTTLWNPCPPSSFFRFLFLLSLASDLDIIESFVPYILLPV